MTPFAIAGVQMYVNALESNVDGMIQRLDILMARFPWTQMVLFSELAPFGPLDRFALPPENETLEVFQAAARKHRVWLIPGSMFLKNPEDGRVYNTAVVINPEGEIIRRYAKMFPFRPYESGIAAGTEFCVFDVPEVGRFGLSICYDMWFPETTRQLTSQGVEVLLTPVLTGTTDRDAELARPRRSSSVMSLQSTVWAQVASANRWSSIRHRWSCTSPPVRKTCSRSKSICRWCVVSAKPA